MSSADIYINYLREVEQVRKNQKRLEKSRDQALKISEQKKLSKTLQSDITNFIRSHLDKAVTEHISPFFPAQKINPPINEIINGPNAKSNRETICRFLIDEIFSKNNIYISNVILVAIALDVERFTDREEYKSINALTQTDISDMSDEVIEAAKDDLLKLFMGAR